MSLYIFIEDIMTHHILFILVYIGMIIRRKVFQMKILCSMMLLDIVLMILPIV